MSKSIGMLDDPDEVQEYVTELDKLRAELSAARTVKIASAEINAMPPHVRGYIAALETACDPSGTIRENYQMRDENQGLRAECQSLAAELSAAKVRIGELEACDIKANRLYRYFNGMDEDTWDKRAEVIMHSFLDGLSIGPSNRETIQSLLAEHFADIGARAERAALTQMAPQPGIGERP